MWPVRRIPSHSWKEKQIQSPKTYWNDKNKKKLTQNFDKIENPSGNKTANALKLSCGFKVLPESLVAVDGEDPPEEGRVEEELLAPSKSWRPVNLASISQCMERKTNKTNSGTLRALLIYFLGPLCSKSIADCGT